MKIYINLDINKSEFAFKHVIGKGSFGYVWKVEKKSNKIPYAIRIMNKALVYNKRSTETLLNEVRLLSTLKHPYSNFLILSIGSL